MSSAIPRIARRQLWVQLRTIEWRVLILAALLAVTLTSFLSIVSDRLESGLLRESASVLGADLVVRSSRPINEQRTDLAEELGLTTTRVIQFPTMVGAGDNLILSSAKVISDPYPLRGEVITDPPMQVAVPEPGTAWAEERIIDQLGLSIGDTLQFGYADLVLTARLKQSPDRGSGFNTLNPHLLVNQQDLEKSAVLGPGSRAEFRLLISGDNDQLKTYEARLKPTLENHERILSLINDQPVTGNALANGLSYVRLSSLTTLLLASLTILLALRRFGHAQQSRSALFLSMGLTPNALVRLYFWQLGIAATVIAVIGGMAGALLAGLADIWLSGLLPQALPNAQWSSYIIGPALGYAMLLLLGMPPALEQAKVPVAQLLRSDQTNTTQKASWGLYLISLVLLSAVLLLFLAAPAAAAVLLIMLGISGLLFGWLAQLILHSLGRFLANRLALGRLLTMRLRQQRKWHRLQAGVMVLLLMLLSVIWVARQDLVKEWQAQFPEDVPNYFLINIQEWQKPGVDQFLADRDIDTELYPMIRGRLVDLNDAPIRPQLNEEQLKDNSLRRELNLTWRQQPPVHNQIIQGEWWDSDSSEHQISIERDMLEDLGLKLGDKLGFDVGGQPVSGVITSVREVKWESFQPNFYVIFSPAALQSYPGTWITSFKLAEERKAQANELLREFPSLTLIDIDQLMKQLAGWLERLAESSAFVLIMTLATGLILVTITLLQALEQRKTEVALLQTLGARATETKQLDLLEFGLLGLVCGSLAVFSAEITLAAMNQFLLKIPLSAHWELWLTLPILASFAFIAIASLLRAPLKIEQCYAILKSNG
ncbi:ABC transporter permease [Marinobacterium sp. xm-d-564]|uniref:ABC transporter permease n=1 Tax=Marinobacterium sp. xm-d-564 TaxID=2497742 RepID=UPI0015693ED1|nr:FtsX-like permease family protein [Marinobacterium sp. xm-d-564]NRP59452.1 FtsX-like permease family protein [Marinobacterium sp. xm-d-564]